MTTVELIYVHKNIGAAGGYQEYEGTGPYLLAGALAQVMGVTNDHPQRADYS